MKITKLSRGSIKLEKGDLIAKLNKDLIIRDGNNLYKSLLNGISLPFVEVMYLGLYNLIGKELDPLLENGWQKYE